MCCYVELLKGESDQRVQEHSIFLSLVEIQPKRAAASRYPDEILMESCIQTITSVLFLYFPQKEPIPNGLIIVYNQVFQGGMEGRFAGVALNLSSLVLVINIH